MRGVLFLLLVISLVGCATAELTPSPDPIAASTLTAGQVSQPDTLDARLPVPNDDPLIPPFTPSYACELQNDTASISDGEYCRSERIQEVIAAQGDNVVFIHRTYRRGSGCWSGINSYSYQLKSCNLTSGESVTLSDKPTTPPIPSPDGLWFAFGVIDVEQFEPHVYRVGNDGSALQKLDTQALPDWAVSLDLVEWSSDGEWLVLKLWDGTTDGWHPYRIATDGSGLYELISPPAITPSPTTLDQPPAVGTATPFNSTRTSSTPEPSASGQTPIPDPTPLPTSTPIAVNCSDTWFFSFPFEYQGNCPRPAVVSQAAVQPFERGLMIWLERPGRYFVLTNQILYAGEQRKASYIVDDPLDVTADTSADYLPPEGLFSPAHGFGLVWRGDAAQSSGFQESLGWATAPESAYGAKYQCESPSISGGRSWQFCYLRASSGDVIVFHALEGWLWMSEWEQSPTDGGMAIVNQVVAPQSGIAATPTSTPAPTAQDASTLEAPATSLEQELPGDLGVTYEFSWELPAAGESLVSREHTFNVTGLYLGSPSRSSRRLFLEMSCQGEGEAQFRWAVTGTQVAEEGSELGCDDSATIFATAEHPDFGILVKMSDGMPVAITYTLQISVHAPY